MMRIYGCGLFLFTPDTDYRKAEQTSTKKEHGGWFWDWCLCHLDIVRHAKHQGRIRADGRVEVGVEQRDVAIGQHAVRAIRFVGGVILDDLQQTSAWLLDVNRYDIAENTELPSNPLKAGRPSDKTGSLS